MQFQNNCIVYCEMIVFARFIFLCNPMNALSDYTQILMYIISYIALRKTILAEMQRRL